MFYTVSRYTSVFGIIQLSLWIIAPISGRLMARDPHNQSEDSPYRVIRVLTIRSCKNIRVQYKLSHPLIFW